MPLDFPPIFLLPTHLQPDDLHRLEASIPSLTYDIHEAQVVLGNISRTQRARFELRRLKVDTETVEDAGAGDGDGDGDGTGRAIASLRVTLLVLRLMPSMASRVPSGASCLCRMANRAAATAAKPRVKSFTYMVYRGRKLASVGGRRKTATATATVKSPRPSPAAAAKDILRRAAGDQGAASGGRPPSSHGPPHHPPSLVRQTTSEHDVPLPPIPDYLHTTYSCQRPTPFNSLNGPFIEELKNIRTLRLLQGDQIGVRAYSTAVATLAAYPYELQVPQEIERLPGCGAKFAGLYGEWRQTGQTKETADAALDSRLTVLKLFHDIWGVGDTTAREFYRKGWRDLGDIITYGWDSLSRLQQIGVKFYDELLLKIPRQEVESIAGVILSHARQIDAGFELAIVGGYRRGKKQSGDVDVVISHRDEEKTLNAVDKIVRSMEDNFITHTLSLAGSRARRRIRHARQGHGAVWQDVARLKANGEGGTEPPPPHQRVDIIVSPWKTVGCALLGWSGGTTFQRDLRRYCKRERGLKFDSSGIRRRADGEWMDLESRRRGGSGPAEPAPDMETAEKRVFEGLGLVWRPPEERCTG
ncbi:DNA polymerase beta [Purpureocillium lavendulum]|uniref:DNA polymerase n=1 Tax=Purpureocillium lavendulum TaxID=1247861 RepID=A0AB34FHS6_9HYPO|nr:DNA polymerase beta [Purpureocillium lavendulum]